LQEAFSKSLNSVAVQLARELKIDDIISNMRKMNIKSKINKDLTIALGTSELSLLELATAFVIIANGGYQIQPSFIKNIISASGEILYYNNKEEPIKIYQNREIAMIKEALRSVITDGTAKRANISQDIYGKTGTSQDFRDAYFVGFNSDYIIAIWIGNDNNKSTNKITGGMLPAILFKELISSFPKV